MKYKIPDLVRASREVAQVYGIEYNDAAKLVAHYSTKEAPETDDILAGNYDAIPAAAKACGVAIKAPRKPVKPNKEKEATNPPKEGKTPTKGAVVDGVRVSKIIDRAIKAAGGVMEVSELRGELPADLKKGELPEGFDKVIEKAIDGFCERFKVDDISKASAERWSGFCMLFGFEVKRSGILEDKEAYSPVKGGKVYDAERVSELAGLWVSLCLSYDKVPLVTDFIAFSGVSDSWFYNCNGESELTSAGVELAQKLRGLQEAGLSGRLVDGKRNPTGTIFFLKNWHGWKDQREIVHSEGTKATNLDALPVFTDAEYKEIAENAENSGFSGQ